MSSATWILNKKAKPIERPAKKWSLSGGVLDFERKAFQRKRAEKMVGKMKNISALLMLPSKMGVEVARAKKSVAKKLSLRWLVVTLVRK